MRKSLLALLLAGLAGHAAVAAATTVSDLCSPPNVAQGGKPCACTASPALCRFTGLAGATSGSTLDFGTRAVELAPGSKIMTSDGGSFAVVGGIARAAGHDERDERLARPGRYHRRPDHRRDRGAADGREHLPHRGRRRLHRDHARLGLRRHHHRRLARYVGDRLRSVRRRHHADGTPHHDLGRPRRPGRRRRLGGIGHDQHGRRRQHHGDDERADPRHRRTDRGGRPDGRRGQHLV